jgi:hypothetical protein
MKTKFKLIFAIIMLFAGASMGAGAEYSKKVRYAWSKNSVSALKISNKFGEVKMNDAGGDSVTILVMITVESKSQSKAEILKNIQIKFEKTGGTVSAETIIQEEFKGKQNFSIDYLVNVPKSKELSITNRYGNVIINELESKGSFDISYGNLTAGKIKTPAEFPLQLTLSYGNANLETVNFAKVDLKYSKLYIDEIDRLNLYSKYSTVNLNKAGNLELDSKYDGINIEVIDQLKSTSKYTNYKIGELSKTFQLESGYGSIRIGKVADGFEKIQIVSSYGGINIALNGLSYLLKANCEFCDIDYPENRYKGNKIRENQSIQLDGNIGSGGNLVSITSKFGGIKLVE